MILLVYLSITKYFNAKKSGARSSSALRDRSTTGYFSTTPRTKLFTATRPLLSAVELYWIVEEPPPERSYCGARKPEPAGSLDGNTLLLTYGAMIIFPSIVPLPAP